MELFCLHSHTNTLLCFWLWAYKMWCFEKSAFFRFSFCDFIDTLLPFTAVYPLSVVVHFTWQIRLKTSRKLHLDKEYTTVSNRTCAFSDQIDFNCPCRCSSHQVESGKNLKPFERIRGMAFWVCPHDWRLQLLTVSELVENTNKEAVCTTRPYKIRCFLLWLYKQIRQHFVSQCWVIFV